MAVGVTFSFSFAVIDGTASAASKSKKYYLPTGCDTEYADDTYTNVYRIKYDKYGNLKSAGVWGAGIPYKIKNKYRKKKGNLSSATVYFDDQVELKKTYDKKGRLTKIKAGKDIYKYKKNRKGIFTKVTRNGKKYYSVKKIKYHKNGFVSKVVYSNGNVNYYNKDGLMTSAKEKKGPKYTYTYTKKKGKVVKVVTKRNGKLYSTMTIEYGKAKTKSVWKYSCAMSFAGAPSNACELYSMSALSGNNFR